MSAAISISKSSAPIQIQSKAAPSRVTTLSSTPGGSIYGTTPGGTRIAYDRSALMNIRNSPLAKTPPAGLPSIPGITLGAPAVTSAGPGPKALSDKNPAKSKSASKDEELFQMDDA